MAKRSFQTGGDSFSHCYSTRGESGGFPAGNYFSRKSRLRRLLLAQCSGNRFPRSSQKRRVPPSRWDEPPRRLFLIKAEHLLPGLASTNGALSFVDLIIRISYSPLYGLGTNVISFDY